MLKNVGLIDRVVRFILVLGFLVFGLLNISTGLWWVGFIGIVPLVTGLAGYCPLWHVFGVNTAKHAKPKK